MFRDIKDIKLVILLSGKRKSGKDYTANILTKKLSTINGCISEILHISEPLKRQYAVEHGLDLKRLLDSSSYKERYRSDMIIWGEERRNLKPSYFCELTANNALETVNANVWIVSDIRRPTDIDYFEKYYQVLKIRIYAKEEQRSQRGWIFTSGVDNAPSECALDNYKKWDFEINNSDVLNISPVIELVGSTFRDII